MEVNATKIGTTETNQRKQIDQYAVFGHPIKHSRSPMIHKIFAQQTAQALLYQAIDSEIDQFEQNLDQFFNQDGKGANITLPFKEQAYEYVANQSNNRNYITDRLTTRAQCAGAVNTLIKRPDGTIMGDTTDGIGLITDLIRLSIPLAGKRVIVFGAGGAARSVIASLLQAGVQQLVITNRTFEKAEQLVTRIKQHQQLSHNKQLVACPIDKLATMDFLSHSHLLKFDLLINSTSLSITNDMIELPSTIIHNKLYCYDMMYQAGTTHFNLWAQQLGATYIYDGLGMLVAQAAESFYLWRGMRPNTQAVLTQLRAELTTHSI